MTLAGIFEFRSAQLSFGLDIAPEAKKGENVCYFHKRIAAYGSKGYVHWTMHGWEKFTQKGGYEHGEHKYGEEDVLGQAGLTDAVAEWLDDPKKVHPTHLPQSLAEFNLIMAIYHSSITRRAIDLPFDPPDKLIEKLKRELQG